MFYIGRAQYSPSAGNYVGAIVTDTESGAAINRVAGGDLSWRVGANQRVTGMALSSRSREIDGTAEPAAGRPAPPAGPTARAAQITQGFFEHYDRGFQMDTAFLNQVGHHQGWAYAAGASIPTPRKYSWIKRSPRSSTRSTAATASTAATTGSWLPGVRMNFTRQGFLRIDTSFGDEPWLGQQYPIDRPRDAGRGAALPLDPVQSAASTGGPRPSTTRWRRSLAGRVPATLDSPWQPTHATNQSIGYRRVDFRRADTREPVYTSTC